MGCFTSFIVPPLLTEKGVDMVQNKSHHYDIDLIIDPKNQFIDASVNLTMYAPSNGIDQLIFFLHRELNLITLKGEKVQHYQFDKNAQPPFHYIPEAGKLTLELIEVLEKSEAYHIDFAYQGKITKWPEWSANVISEDWTEIGLYFPWFPYNPDLGDFTFAIEVKCEPAYTVCSYGKCQNDGGLWQVNWDLPTNDIVLVMGKDIQQHSIEKAACKVHVNSVTLRQETAKTLMADVSSIIANYDAWFSGPTPEEISIIQSPRKKGGGYSRRGLVVLGGLQDEHYVEHREGYTRYLGHELAHFWWHQANTASWEDWLNESFAEFSALMVVRQIFGEQSFEKRLAAKQETCVNSSPIWGVDRADISTENKRKSIEIALYKKGPLILAELEDLIGKENFKLVCREMISRGINTTRQFLDLLREIESDSICQWMEMRLKES